MSVYYRRQQRSTGTAAVGTTKRDYWLKILYRGTQRVKAERTIAIAAAGSKPAGSGATAHIISQAAETTSPNRQPTPGAATACATRPPAAAATLALSAAAAALRAEEVAKAADTSSATVNTRAVVDDATTEQPAVSTPAEAPGSEIVARTQTPLPSDAGSVQLLAAATSSSSNPLALSEAFAALEKTQSATGGGSGRERMRSRTAERTVERRGGSRGRCALANRSESKDVFGFSCVSLAATTPEAGIATTIALVPTAGAPTTPPATKGARPATAAVARPTAAPAAAEATAGSVQRGWEASAGDGSRETRRVRNKAVPDMSSSPAGRAAEIMSSHAFPSFPASARAARATTVSKRTAVAAETPATPWQNVICPPSAVLPRELAERQRDRELLLLSSQLCISSISRDVEGRSGVFGTHTTKKRDGLDYEEDEERVPVATTAPISVRMHAASVWKDAHAKYIAAHLLSVGGNTEAATAASPRDTDKENSIPEGPSLVAAATAAAGTGAYSERKLHDSEEAAGAGVPIRKCATRCVTFFAGSTTAISGSFAVRRAGTTADVKLGAEGRAVASRPEAGGIRSWGSSCRVLCSPPPCSAKAATVAKQRVSSTGSASESNRSSSRDSSNGSRSSRESSCGLNGEDVDCTSSMTEDGSAMRLRERKSTVVNNVLKEEPRTAKARRSLLDIAAETVLFGKGCGLQQPQVDENEVCLTGDPLLKERRPRAVDRSSRHLKARSNDVEVLDYCTRRRMGRKSDSGDSNSRCASNSRSDSGDSSSRCYSNSCSGVASSSSNSSTSSSSTYSNTSSGSIQRTHSSNSIVSSITRCSSNSAPSSNRSSKDSTSLTVDTYFVEGGPAPNKIKLYVGEATAGRATQTAAAKRRESCVHTVRHNSSGKHGSIEPWGSMKHNADEREPQEKGDARTHLAGNAVKEHQIRNSRQK